LRKAAIGPSLAVIGARTFAFQGYRHRTDLGKYRWCATAHPKLSCEGKMDHLTDLNSTNFPDGTASQNLQNCRKSADQSASIPPEFYTSKTFSQIEIDRIFRRGWIGVGRADRLATAGDYETLDIAGQSLILLRDHEGNLRTFANTCRHRGARLLDGRGNCRGIRCPFHSWAYKLDGALAGVPRADQIKNFDRGDFGLITHRVAERLGFVFVCLDQETPDIDTWLGDFQVLHHPWPIETLVSTRRRELTVNCNWKAFIEVFNEYYHLPFVHPDSINDVYDDPDPGDTVSGAFASQFGSTEGTGALLQTTQQQPLPQMPGLSGREAAGVRYSWIFPNMTFAAGVDAVWLYEAYPLGPDRCQVFQTACFPPETVALPDFDEKVAAYYHRLDAALDEDIPALENQHRGLSSPDARPGRFHPHLEANVAAFARWYAGQM
jgi:phenylpropionate dioxygenase-like ring-hydroxylating dioxygenase large terminal subunit